MENSKKVKTLRKSAQEWNKWRENTKKKIKPDLRGEDLSGEDLSEADLSEADLSGADLRKAILHKADLREAQLRKADLCSADLTKAKLHKANFNEANLNKAILIEANLSGANLSRAILVEADLYKANLTNSNVYGISAWDMKNLKETTQSGLIISRPKEPPVTVDDIEVAQFVYLLINNQKIRNVINTVTSQGVLILGRFGGGGIKVLRAVAEKLREMKYLPIIFDFKRPRDRTYTETIKTLAGLSRFVIVDLSGPSVPNELQATVPHFQIPFVPILEKGEQPYEMFKDILVHDWVIKPIVEFDSPKSLIKELPSKIVEPAEKRHERRQKILSETFGK